MAIIFAYARQCLQELDSVDEAFINGIAREDDPSGRFHQGSLFSFIYLLIPSL